ncbi:NigD1/NigD2 family lipoprotein [Mangrovibacterium diazotrophicum]|uniref:NigD-like protein n=1 Tax=Mangrovibacterium diazotrophicum TaxID=1261403 RepID=A0A419W8X1_9BACT|nr:NigD-like protein [Mangrovibacterium diazotrophicum]RKD91874.1 NigD-like protein [Mangrovibacterium diazotrophicum]
MKLLKNGFFFLLISVFLVSCNDDDDDYSLGKYWITTGTVVKSSDYFSVTTDGGDKLWPSATNVDPEHLEDGMRVFVNYTILDDAEESSGYDYYVKINSMSEILTKPIFNFTAETTEEVRDSIGNDAVTITDTWFTDDYLNVQFEYGGGLGFTHFINLVKDTDDLETGDGEIILELKHNKNGDPYNYLQWGIASFDISELQVDGQTSVDIYLRALDKEGEYQYNLVLTYDYSLKEAQAKVFQKDDMLNMLE